MFRNYFLPLTILPYSVVGTSYINTSLLIASARDSGGWGWGWSGSGSSASHSYFDIALTALAFLSFGIFLLNLLMNALFFTTTQGLTSTGPIVTNIDTATAGGGDDGGGEVPAETLIYIRRKRSPLDLKMQRADAANALASTVLKSIDAMVEKHECLSKIICDENRQAQAIGYGFQYIMPLYSLSSSYIGEKLGFHRNLTDHLDAILHGVTESNCRSQYPSCSECN